MLIDIKNVKSGIFQKIGMSYADKRDTLENHLDHKTLEKLEKMRRNL
jgi:hypothetical protein